jgi:hypothetical protein
VSYYVLRNKYTLPGFLFRAVASWVIALAGMTIVLLLCWGISAITNLKLLDLLPGPLVVFLDICGAYAGIGAICLYVTMWIYWIAVERSSVLARIGWFFALLFGLHYGALIYAFIVWRKGVTKVDGPQPLADASVRG